MVEESIKLRRAYVNFAGLSARYFHVLDRVAFQIALSNGPFERPFHGSHWITAGRLGQLWKSGPFFDVVRTQIVNRKLRCFSITTP